MRATYSALNTVLSALSYPFGTVDGTHMTLPDLQGRSLVAMASGGHASVNGVGDHDGLAKASRTPLETIFVAGNVNGGTVSGVTLAESMAGNEFVLGAGAGASFTPHVHGFSDAPLAGATFSGSGNAVGNFLVAGVHAVKV